MDTIAAIATALAPSGVAIIRMSGPEALPILSSLFSPYKGKVEDGSFFFKPRYMHYGKIKDENNAAIDDVLVVYMPGPHSFTGEDVVEIHCHGGVAITRCLLDALFSKGVRPAEKGEFTKRAFLHGRIDLTQAEAVIEMINAPSKEGIRLAHAKLDGALGIFVNELRAQVDSLRVLITVLVDFLDDEEEILPRDRLLAEVQDAIARTEKLLAGYERAKLWREGALVVLVGQVNAGKSSLLNAFLGRERAIVSDIPGTTRDYIEESVSLEGIPLRMVDTAGLRVSGDIIENEGIRKSTELAEQADIILLTCDATQGIGAIEKAFLSKHHDLFSHGNLLVIFNKIDMLAADELTELRHNVEEILQCPFVFVSAKDHAGIEALSAGIKKVLFSSSGQMAQGDVAPNARQRALLVNTVTELKELLNDVEAGLPADILGIRLDTAAMYLDEVTGIASTDQLLDTIFSTFCIGK